MSRDYEFVTRGGQISRKSADRIAEQTGTITASWCLGPNGGLAADSGLVDNQPPQPLYFQITGAQKADNSFPYSQVVESSATKFTAPGAPLTDAVIPLFEIDNSPISQGAIVRAWLSDDQTHYLTWIGQPGPTITIEDSSLAPRVTNVKVIETFRTSGLDLNLPGGGPVSASTTGTWASGGFVMTVASSTGIAVGQLIQATDLASNTQVTGINGLTINFFPAAMNAGNNEAVNFFAASTVFLDLLPASPTQQGAMATGTQVFSGQKTWQNQQWVGFPTAGFGGKGQPTTGLGIGEITIQPSLFNGTSMSVLESDLPSAYGGAQGNTFQLLQESTGYGFILIGSSGAGSNTAGQWNAAAFPNVFPATSGAYMKVDAGELLMSSSDGANNGWQINFFPNSFQAYGINNNATILGFGCGIVGNGSYLFVLDNGGNSHTGAWGTSGGGDTVSGGLITSLGSAGGINGSFGG